MRFVAFSSFCLTCFLTLSSDSQAALLLNGSGHAVGITDLEVGGVFYNVTFGVGSYNDVFGTQIDPDPLPTFDGDFVSAFEARNAIAAELNAGSVSLVADDSSGATADSVIVPHDHDETFFIAYWTGSGTYQAPPPWGDTSGISGPRDSDSALYTFSWAQFEAQATVPEPGTIVLSSLGVLAVGVMSRKRRKRETLPE